MTSDLRKRAEFFLNTNPEETPTVATADVKKLVHELAVHQIELEMQNEELREAQLELSHSRDAYAELYDFAPVGYLTLDRQGMILEANHTAATMLQVERSLLLRRKFSDFVDRDAQDAWFRHRQQVIATHEKQIVQLALRTADRNPITARLECRPRRLAGTEDWRCMMALIDITARMHVEEDLRRLYQELEQRIDERTSELRRLSAELALAEERERLRIAGEVHDELGQVLTMCLNELHLIGLEEMSDEAARGAQRLRGLLVRAASETRELTYELSSPLLHTLGLAPALEQLCVDLERKHRIGFVFQDDGLDKDLSEANRIALFRCVRELLINVTKHARASEAYCSVSLHGDYVRAKVDDNGIGFDASDAGTGFSPLGGYGLFNLREYAHHVGGRLELESSPGTGTRVVLEIPTKERA